MSGSRKAVYTLIKHCYSQMGANQSHQEASEDFPGCTDLAYKKAVSDGADIIDCPVQMTSDGEVTECHFKKKFCDGNKWSEDTWIALFKEGKITKLSYPLEKFHSDVSGRSFHNGNFIQRKR